MSQATKDVAGVRKAEMPKITVTVTRVSLAELIKRTNQTPLRITAQQ